MTQGVVLKVERLGFPWTTLDPFLFCVHHDDAYPAGNAQMGPAASLAGRQLGSDFAGKDGWRMYHGQSVPGFPQHPHRGFETITVVRSGLIDHADSMGATARFGEGDTQWMTAGQGVVHSEMFPLVHQDKGNPLELFQIWLNLPSASKMSAPYFTMLWSHATPKLSLRDDAGRLTEVLVVAGALGDANPLPTPPDSWASRPEGEVAIWALNLSPNATCRLPPASVGVNRSLYVFGGSGVTVGGVQVPKGSWARLRPDAEALIEAAAQGAEALVLQGRPIGEPVAQHGPFVMNTPAEVQQAFADYRRTQFGGWPWPSDAPVHPRQQARFARHADGRVETPPSSR
jgi:redox-sensitive bicupin YhaK (pirin superfamily)